MGIADANNAGNVHGGLIMHMCDEVAGIAAVRHSGARVVTAAMDRMTFRHPVFVGGLVTVRATVNAAWRSSMEVGVRVESEDVRTGEITHTSTAYLTMVALDDEGRPTEVVPVAPETPDEQRRERARALFERLARADPSAAEFQAGLARTYNNIGSLHLEAGRPAEAMAWDERALAIRERLLGEQQLQRREGHDCNSHCRKYSCQRPIARQSGQ